VDERLRFVQYCYTLTITDFASRYLLTCRALSNTLETYAFAVFERTFKDFGLPRAIRTDSGARLRPRMPSTDSASCRSGGSGEHRYRTHPPQPPGTEPDLSPILQSGRHGPAMRSYWHRWRWLDEGRFRTT
jgi:hypothetical protein